MRVKQEPQPYSDANIALMQVMEFNIDDISANRQGLMSENQRETLTGERWYWRMWSVTIVVAVPLLIALTIGDGINRHDTIASRIGMVALILILASILYTYTHSRWKRVHTDIIEGRVSSVTGAVELKVHQDRNGRRYDLRVKTMKFILIRRVAEAFQQGETYCIYYAPHSKIALSAELITADNHPESPT